MEVHVREIFTAAPVGAVGSGAGFPMCLEQPPKGNRKPVADADYKGREGHKPPRPRRRPPRKSGAHPAAHNNTPLPGVPIMWLGTSCLMLSMPRGRAGVQRASKAIH